MAFNNEDLTIGQVNQILERFGQKIVNTPLLNPTPVTSVWGPWEIGKDYLIRTVTMIDAGTLVGVTEHELILENASWIPDTGRFADAIAKAEFGEVEPFPDGRVIVGRGGLIDAVQIKKTPRRQK